MEDGREKMEERIDIFYHLAEKKNGRKEKKIYGYLPSRLCIFYLPKMAGKEERKCTI